MVRVGELAQRHQRLVRMCHARRAWHAQRVKKTDGHRHGRQQRSEHARFVPGLAAVAITKICTACGRLRFVWVAPCVRRGSVCDAAAQQRSA